ncbi:hypothetical protein [Winogradskyella tangerina]|uniref:hypothetical protein n=1 Tax=Winogradskyella tangerina TaxID=2023240 RepID=UPI000DBE761C|nr:hypothetical protein [Winogradskyella tangerina]
MKHIDHCNLCEHQSTDLKIGFYCGLTNRKPEFYKTCIKANFDNKLATKIEDVNIDYEDIKRQKWRVYTNSILLFILGILLLICSYYMSKFVSGLKASEYWRYRYVSYGLTACFLGSLLFVFPAAIRLLNRYRNEIRSAKIDKEKVDKVLELYGISYTINITFTRGPLGYDEVDIDLIIKK